MLYRHENRQLQYVCVLRVSVLETQYRYFLLVIKPTRYTILSNLFLEWNSTCFGQFLYPSTVFHCTHSNGICQQTCMTYTITVCTVKNSCWWTEKLSETCRVLFQNKFARLVHLVGFIIRIYHDAQWPESQYRYFQPVHQRPKVQLPVPICHYLLQQPLCCKSY